MRAQFILLLVLSTSGPVAQAQVNPLKLAGLARFDLLANGNVGRLTNGWMLTDAADVARQLWLDAASQPRSYTVNFETTHCGWTEAAFRFTAVSNGTVTLTLLGPYENSTNGNIYRQEILWDACSATNATLLNGSFETLNGSAPLNWSRPSGDATVNTGPVPPVNGSRYARVWHNGPLAQTFAVSGGVPVTLRCFARAQIPANYTDMPRLTGLTPAHQTALRFMRGVNFGNYLDTPPGQIGNVTYTTNDFTYVRNEGFDHVRLPIGWHYHTGPAPNYTLSNGILASADFLITNALNRGLAVLVDLHNFTAFAADPYGNTNKFYAIWRQLASRYSNSPSQLAFELNNEPNGAATTAVMNSIYAEAIRQIRLNNPARTIFVGPSQWNSLSELSNLQLPAAESNIIVTVHSYDPFYFTHQGATWSGPDTATTGLIFPGPPTTPLRPAAGVGSWVTNWIASYNSTPAAANPSSSIAFRAKLERARQWADYYGRPVHIGEFGSYSAFADASSRTRYYADFRAAAEALGLGWAMWDWKAGFRYWDDAARQPAAGMRAAMFPAPRLNSTGAGQFNFDSALAKTFVIQRATSLRPANWSAVQTQTLTQPRFLFAEPATNQNAAFYRALWSK
jgi:endoglucanase